MNTTLKITLLLIAIRVFSACSANGNDEQTTASLPAPPAPFSEYWYQGKAELTRYDLEQARYGEIHSGEAVIVFVTEDFLKNTQVKYEFGTVSEPIEKVLKMNFNRRFFTGIYPYSTLVSVFTPVDETQTHSLKTSTSVQEWCGQVYMQLNLQGNEYRAVHHSYFQAEADQQMQLPAVWLEDELWTRLRLNPASLPVGDFSILPGTLYLRLRHKPIQLENATATLTNYSEETLSDKPLKAYTLSYTSIRRSLKIIFEAEFPHKIVAWEEKIPGGADWLTTRARKSHEVFTDYWRKNTVADSVYREQLGM